MRNTVPKKIALRDSAREERTFTACLYFVASLVSKAEWNVLFAFRYSDYVQPT